MRLSRSGSAKKSPKGETDEEMTMNQENGRLAKKLKFEYRNRGLGAFSSGFERGMGAGPRKRAGKGKRKWRDLMLRIRFRQMAEKEAAAREIAVEKKRISLGFLLFLAFSTMMIMLIVMFGSRIYETKREISSLENQVAVLRENIDELELKLEEKNDIRLIEQIATASLGMVKEDSLQRKYISLSEGERVDIVSEPETSNKGMGTMLSSIFAVFGDFLEFFK